jgi:hypothetical protein
MVNKCKVSHSAIKFQTIFTVAEGLSDGRFDISIHVKES